MSIFPPTRHSARNTVPASVPGDSLAIRWPARLSGHPLLKYWEIGCFAALCTADMLSTLYWYLHGEATERNPLLSHWLAKSVTAFCIAKLVSFVPLLVICAIYRRRYPKLIVFGLRVAIIAYVGIYVASVGAQLLPR